MSRLTLRRKGAIRAAVISAAGLLGAAVPMSAFGATGMTINLQLAPGAAGASSTSKFVIPTEGAATPVPVTVYVYATVTGGGATTASNFQGLQYLYYNINGGASSSAPTALGGVISAPTLDANFNGGASIGDAGSGYGDQAGVATGAAAPGLVLGSATAITSMAKPRSGTAIWGTPANLGSDAADMYNVGNATSFLVETLKYTPGSTASTVVGGVVAQQTNLSVSVPSSAALGALVGANWFQDSSATSTPSAAIQNGAYTAGTGVTLTNALLGDTDLSGAVNITDFNTLGHNFNQPQSANGNLPYTWAQGDFSGDGNVNITDFNDLAHNFNQGGLGTGPLAADALPLIQFAIANNDLAGFEAATGLTTAEIDAVVPEPTSLSLLALGGVALLGRRKRVSG